MPNEKIVGVRLGRALDRNVDEVVKKESVDKSTALRMLVKRGYKDWKTRRALQLLRDGKISVWRASKEAEMTLWDFLAVIKREEGTEWAEFDRTGILSKKS